MSDQITISKSEINQVLDRINGVLCQSLYVLNVVAFPVVVVWVVRTLSNFGAGVVEALLAGCVVATMWCGIVAALLSIRQHVKETERQNHATNRLMVESMRREQ